MDQEDQFVMEVANKLLRTKPIELLNLQQWLMKEYEFDYATARNAARRVRYAIENNIMEEKFRELDDFKKAVLHVQTGVRPCRAFKEKNKTEIHVNGDGFIDSMNFPEEGVIKVETFPKVRKVKQQELSVDPPVCPIQANGGTSKHKIINNCDKMLAYKVKSSNNSNYSVNASYGLIQIGQIADLIIKRKPGKRQADRLVIQYASVEQTCRDPKAPFATGQPVGELCGETIIKLSADE